MHSPVLSVRDAELQISTNLYSCP